MKTVGRPTEVQRGHCWHWCCQTCLPCSLATLPTIMHPLLVAFHPFFVALERSVHLHKRLPTFASVVSKTQLLLRPMQSAEKREMCYQARDAFHKCLDTLPEDPEKACANLKKAFSQSCPKSWVSYFEKQREREVILQLQVDQYKGPSV